MGIADKVFMVTAKMSRSYVYRCSNDITVEAYISTVLCSGSLVFMSSYNSVECSLTGYLKRVDNWHWFATYSHCSWSHFLREHQWSSCGPGTESLGEKL